MRLLIAEKPSMGRAIAAALGLRGSGRSCIEGDQLIVTWCVGHLVEALEPDAYDPSWKIWKAEDLPIDPIAFHYRPAEATKDQYAIVQRLLLREDITDVVNATDAGREGELIFDLVYRLAGCTKPVQRFWAHSLTEDAIREAYATMQPGESYAGLRDAARSRQESDWLVGINATRAQTLAARRSGGEGLYSVGRVQTPTLAILVRRELEIRDFVPKDFWTLWAHLTSLEGSFKAKWFHVDGTGETDRFDTEEAAKALAASLAGRSASVKSVTAKTEKKRPELLYDLTTLQKEGNKRFGLTAERTLELAQSLYEKQLMSYPRTNSRYLTEADAAKAPGWIKAISQGQFAELHPFVDELRKRWPVKLDKRFVNDAEVEDHSALVPTDVPARGLTGDEARIYELVARRFLAAYWPERVEAKTAVVVGIEQETFKANGTVLKDPGWSVVDPPHGRKKEKSGNESEDDEAETEGLPPLKKGQALDTEKLVTKPGKTTPPKRMGEADLLSAMQGAGRELEDDELRGAMRDCGLGTPATRASIIETLISREFITRKRNVLIPSDKGIELIQRLPVEALKSPQLTGEWEARLECMRRGTETREVFMAGIRTFVQEAVDQIRASMPARRVFGKVLGPCPKCGSDLHLRDWEGSHYARCSGTADPECKVSYSTDAEGKQLFTCACGGPVRETKKGSKVCVVCGKWDSTADPSAPKSSQCPTCGKPMRVLASTRKGQWFPCGAVNVA